MQAEEFILAPMEGVIDYPMRRVLTGLNRYDCCVSEFIRVTDTVFPPRFFRREVPELAAGGRTEAGTPVWVQILGTDPEVVAGNARAAARCGALGVDLNFGCPSRFVHRSGGGAAMLRDPAGIGAVVRRTRDLLPPAVPLSVKIRLGWDDPAELGAIYENVVRGGADRLVIHARTRRDGFRPGTARWDLIAPFAARREIVLVANGDVRDAASAAACMEASGCSRLMAGRGALAVPNLERVVRGGAAPFGAREALGVAAGFAAALRDLLPERYRLARTKQFLGYIREGSPEIRGFFALACRQTEAAALEKMLEDAAAGGPLPEAPAAGTVRARA